jgi:hypothetical protein
MFCYGRLRKPSNVNGMRVGASTARAAGGVKRSFREDVKEEDGSTIAFEGVFNRVFLLRATAGAGTPQVALNRIYFSLAGLTMFSTTMTFASS